MVPGNMSRKFAQKSAEMAASQIHSSTERSAGIHVATDIVCKRSDQRCHGEGGRLSNRVRHSVAINGQFLLFCDQSMREKAWRSR